MDKIKVVWLCNYSLIHLKDEINLDLDYSRFHPVPWLYYLTNEISKRENIELHVVTLKSVVPADIDLCKNGVHYHIIKQKELFLPAIKNGRLTKIKIRQGKMLWSHKILRLIDRISPDIINVHGTEGELQLLANHKNYPTLIWMQGLMQQVIKTQRTKKYLYWLKNETEIIKKQNHFITFRGEMESIIQSVNPNAKFYNIYHPNPEYAFDMYYENYEKDADVVFVGELIKRKGIEDFIQMVAIIKKSHNDVKAKIIGFTGDKDYLQSISEQIEHYKLKENITVMGFIESHAEVLKEIKKSKVFVLPTYVDTGPRSVAESMTIGIPVVSYNIDGLPNMVENGADGFLVAPGNVVELTRAVLNLLHDSDLYSRIRLNAFNSARLKYLPNKVVDDLIVIYNYIIQEHKKLAA